MLSFQKESLPRKSLVFMGIQKISRRFLKGKRVQILDHLSPKSDEQISKIWIFPPNECTRKHTLEKQRSSQNRDRINS